jgi:hypothetical protein
VDADVVIVVLTGYNENVVCELGIAPEQSTLGACR